MHQTADNTIIKISKVERNSYHGIKRDRKNSNWKPKNTGEKLHRKVSKIEQTHYDSLTQVLDGTVPSSDCNDSDGRNYEPRAIYTAASQSEDKMHDAFLATDAIGTEKLVSGEYNTNVFMFGDSDLRKLMADIQVEEQNHAEMLYKYKTANGMQ